MNGYRSNGLNQFWFGLVLIHIIGSNFLVLFLSIPSGIILLNSIFWVYCAYANRQNKWAILLSSIGWSINLYILNHMALGYQCALLMNVFLFTFVFFLHYGSFPLLSKENRLKTLNAKDIIYILLLTVMVFIIAGYVNALSTLFVNNHVLASLEGVREHLWEAVLVSALAPAIVEEILYRGYVFQRLGDGWKTVLISSVLFALAHMNFNQMAYAFVIGLIFAMIFHVTGNLYYSILIHFLFNLYNIVDSAFCDHRIIHGIRSIHLGDYYVFNVSFYNEQGVRMMGAIWMGALVCMIAILVAFAILYMLSHTYHPDKMKELSGFLHKSFQGKEEAWRPDFLFVAACLLCIIAAFSLDRF